MAFSVKNSCSRHQYKVIALESIHCALAKGGGKHALCTVAAKRARQIIEKEKNAGITDSTGKDKELLTACKDIAEGKVVIAKD